MYELVALIEFWAGLCLPRNEHKGLYQCSISGSYNTRNSCWVELHQM